MNTSAHPPSIHHLQHVQKNKPSRTTVRPGLAGFNGIDAVGRWLGTGCGILVVGGARQETAERHGKEDELRDAYDVDMTAENAYIVGTDAGAAW